MQRQLDPILRRGERWISASTRGCPQVRWVAVTCFIYAVSLTFFLEQLTRLEWRPPGLPCPDPVTLVTHVKFNVTLIPACFLIYTDSARDVLLRYKALRLTIGLWYQRISEIFKIRYFQVSYTVYFIEFTCFAVLNFRFNPFSIHFHK